jgi:5-methyltetrahydrofolate corrinoid/iron sulfur protein methyltransferase
MILIGERINTGFKKIKAAVQNKDGDVIKEAARKQADAGADYIDVNLGAISNNPDDLCWMIEMVQEEVDLPISIDNNKIELLKVAIPICRKPPLVNSVIADDEKLDEILPVVAEYKASIIGLAMSAVGTPATADKRVENAGVIIAKVMEYDIPTDRLFLDPIVMPLKFMQDQAIETMKAGSQFGLFADPPCHVVCGLSNISSGTIYKGLINRVYAAMLIANGLDAVILNVNDTELVDTILTAELILNKGIYADSYLEAFRR